MARCAPQGSQPRFLYVALAPCFKKHCFGYLPLAVEVTSNAFLLSICNYVPFSLLSSLYCWSEKRERLLSPLLN